MPELPEVETIRMGLEKYLVGHRIVGVEVRLKKIVQGDVKKVVGGKVKGVRRFGKALSIDLNNGWSIASHIKLTGQWIYRGQEVPSFDFAQDKQAPNALIGGELPNKWTHVVFKLDPSAGTSAMSSVPNGSGQASYLYYNDIRQFGWIKIVPTEDVVKLPFVHELGPEPPVAKAMEGRSPLTRDVFKKIISSSRTQIKPLLMDQKKIGGVGNIYANDALFLARIDPRRKTNSLSLSEQSKLYKDIEEVLKRGLKYGGATEMNFVNVLGQPGGYQKYFLVYGREGKPCLGKCGGKIQKIRLGGRGTYYCPNCQK